MLRPGDVAIVLSVRDGHVPLALHEADSRELARRTRARRGRADWSTLMRLLRTRGARLISLEQLVVAALDRLRLLVGLYLDLAPRAAQGVLAGGGPRPVGRSRGDVLRDALNALRLLRLVRVASREVNQILQGALDTLVLALSLRLHLSSGTLKVPLADVEGTDPRWLLARARHTLLGAALRALRFLHSLRLHVALLLRRVLRLLEAALDLVETLLVDFAGPALRHCCQRVLQRGSDYLVK